MGMRLSSSTHLILGGKDMKYLKEAAVKSGALWFTTISLIVALVSNYMSASALKYIGLAIDGYKDPARYVSYIIIAYLVKIILRMVQSYTDLFGSSKAFNYLNDKFAEKLATADYKMFVKFSSSDLQTTSAGIKAISFLIRYTLEIMNNTVEFIILLVMMIPIAGFRITFVVGVIYIVMTVLLLRAYDKYDATDRDKDAEVRKRNKEIDEMINGFNEVRSFVGLGKYHHSEVKKYNNNILTMLVRRCRIDVSISCIMIGTESITTVAVLMYLIMQLQAGTITVTTTAMTVIMYIGKLLVPVVMIANMISQLAETRTPLKKYTELMDYEDEITDGDIELEAFETSIRFNNVKFGYDNSSLVLDDVSFEIKQGQHIGICGPSGGGKSTLLKLLPRFYDTNDGSICIDGIDIKKLKIDSFRKHIGVVHQSPFIFDGTILDNIEYGRKGEFVTSKEVKDACKKASIYDFIMSLPEGFNTKVGPKGMKLSGGQKQRIALARIFLYDPEIIILDEATSALDNETERLIQESLESLKDKTMITVAHRLSTIKDCDKIVVIEEHKIKEEGTHEELLAAGGLYNTMWNK